MIASLTACNRSANDKGFDVMCGSAEGAAELETADCQEIHEATLNHHLSERGSPACSAETHIIKLQGLTNGQHKGGLASDM